METIATTYETFFSLKIIHPSFKDYEPYIAIGADDSTLELLRKMRMVEKQFLIKTPKLPVHSTCTVVQIMTEMMLEDGSKKPFYKMGEDQHLVFLMKVIDDKFLLMTDLDFTGFPKQIFHFSHTGDSIKKSENCPVESRMSDVLNETFQKGKVPRTVSIVSCDKKEIVFFRKLEAEDTVFKYDPFDCKSGFYALVKTFDKKEDTIIKKFYYNSFPRKESLFGIIDVNISAIKTVNDKKNNFIIEFKPKK